MEVKRRKFLQNKLWRDNMIEQVQQYGSLVHWRSLDDDSFDRELRIKLAEETDEVRLAKTTQELIEELADVLEVVETLCALHSLSFEDVKKAQAKKRSEKGGFTKRAFVTMAEHLPGSISEQYCLQQPEKYPEIKE